MSLVAEHIAKLYEELGVLHHPVLKLPSPGQVTSMLERPNGRQELIEWLKLRRRRIELAERDPLNWGFEAQTWVDADGLLRGGEFLSDCYVLGIFGGNRAMKSWYAVKRACQTAMFFPGARITIMAENLVSSISTVQRLAWYYLQPHVGHLNAKRDAIHKVNYSQANGFTDGKLVLPNGSEVYFLTYNQEPGDYEGWEFGAPPAVYERINEERMAKGLAWLPNVGVMADESMTLAWLRMYTRRLKFRKAKLLWAFTPVRGMTPAIKETVGSSAVTVASRPSELLPRKNLPDVPEGQMPYVRKCALTGAMAIYFFTIYNPWGPGPGRTYYQEVRDLCAGKTSEYTERVAYGLARDGVARAFPKFGPWNIVKRSQLPKVGTNYFFADPAGSRNWFMMWVRVTPGDPPCHYIYRDWPDAKTHGEWAVATEREVNEENRKGWDGDAGPAQSGMGYGVVRYKQTILECERVKVSGKEEDPYRLTLIEKAKRSKLTEIQEEIAERYVDPRAGKSEHLAEEGGTCITEEFLETQVDANGAVTGAGMELIPASGVNMEEGFQVVNDLLDWNQEQPLMSVMNQPHLFVCEGCEQVRWMFENYTGRAGEKGAAKDPADLARYMALAKLDYVEGRFQGKPGRGF